MSYTVLMALGCYLGIALWLAFSFWPYRDRKPLGLVALAIVSLLWLLFMLIAIMMVFFRPKRRL